MRLVRCNKCKGEYVICGMGVECEFCGAIDFTILENDVKIAYSGGKDDMDTQQEDLKHSLLLFKEELDELIKTYIEPFLK